MTLITLSVKQQKELLRVQNALSKDVIKAAREYSSELNDRVLNLLKRVQRAGYDRRKISREIYNLMSRMGEGLNKQVLRLVLDANRYADTYVKRLVQYDVTDMQALPPHVIKWASKGYGGPGARAAIAFIRGRSAGSTERLFAVDGRLALSRNLHRMNAKELENVSQQVLRAIREAQDFGFASREMVHSAKGIGAGDRLPRLLRKIDRTTGGEIKADIKKIKRYMRKLKGGLPDEQLAKELGVTKVRAGRMKQAYFELAEKLEKGGAVDGAIKHWVHQKQRYRAETILRSETAAAYRQAQAQQSEERPWIVGYKVKMQRASHARFVASKPGKLKALGGKHCLCELYDGKIIPAQDYRDIWYRGFHPRCNCQFAEVINKDMLWEHFGADRKKI